MSSGRSSSPKSSRRGTSYRRKKKKKKKTKLILPKISNDEQLMMDRMKKYWYDSLTAKPSKEEQLNIPGYTFISARQVIYIDSYEARGLRKSIQCDSIAQLFQLFIKYKGRNMLPELRILITNALFSNREKAQSIISNFEIINKYIESNDFKIPPQSKNKFRNQSSRFSPNHTSFSTSSSGNNPDNV